MDFKKTSASKTTVTNNNRIIEDKVEITHDSEGC